jgi:DNA-directed RNA polymerase subunit RPC12/RpoP
MASLIMCPRVDEAPKYKPELEPEQWDCQECGDAIYIAKSSREMIETQPQVEWKIVCNPCAQKLLARQRDTHPDAVTPLAVAPTVAPDFIEKLQRAVDRVNDERQRES